MSLINGNKLNKLVLIGVLSLTFSGRVYADWVDNKETGKTLIADLQKKIEKMTGKNLSGEQKTKLFSIAYANVSKCGYYGNTKKENPKCTLQEDKTFKEFKEAYPDIKFPGEEGYVAPDGYDPADRQFQTKESTSFG